MSRAAVLCHRRDPYYRDEVYIDVYVVDAHPNVNLDTELTTHNDPVTSDELDGAVRYMFNESPGPRGPDGSYSLLKEVVHTLLPFRITHREVHVGDSYCCGLILTEDALALVVRVTLLLSDTPTHCFWC